MKAYAEAENLPILMQIPFDRRIAEAYSKGQMLVEVMPEWKEKFIGLYERIKILVEANKKGRKKLAAGSSRRQYVTRDGAEANVRGKSHKHFCRR